MSDQNSNGGGKPESSNSPWKRATGAGAKPERSADKGGFSKFKAKRNPKTEKKNDLRYEREQQKKEKRMIQAADLESEIRLNRFIALAGVCSRREADNLIKRGAVKVNGKVTKEMGQKVTPGKDVVIYGGQELKVKKFLYLLMNKPKDHISTVKDEAGRRTVMDIVRRYTPVRIYPVGRLDRNTTGLLLFTNDGDATAKLTHPSFEVTKVYQVRLDKEVDPEHLMALKKGVELEDGLIKVDKIGMLDSGGPNEVGVSLHSGRNRIVRRMFEHFGYVVISLDRVQFGPLDKKGLPRGKCRVLTDKEIGFLKML